jgi:hypothetical protein
MMTKEQFIKRISLIQNFQKEQNILNDLVDMLVNGNSVVYFGDNLINEIINIISEDMEIDENDDLIDWWLYEDVEKILYDEDDNGKEIKINVKTAEQLYDYIVENYNK